MEEKRTASAGTETVKKSPKWAWLAAAALAGAVTGSALGLCLYANGYNGVFPGVTVGGADLSGYTYEELAHSLPTDGLLNESISITADGQDLGTYSQAQLGAAVDQEALREDAWAVGRESGVLGWLKNAWTMLQGKLGAEIQLEPSVSSYDNAALAEAAAQAAAVFDRSPVDGSYELTREGLFATKPADGRALDQGGLVQSLAALEGGGGTVDAPWQSVPAAPLDLNTMAGEVIGDATPARYDIELGRVVDGQPGATLDVDAAAFVLEAAAPGERVQLPAKSVYPELTAQELEAVLFRDVLATASTNVSGTAPRRNNVRLSGEIINGTVLNDGDIFDYNQVVGRRTAERGFGAASAYINGLTVDTIGGGICQTSSTIYLAALLSNLEIVERYNHRFYPGYITLGMDATVSWGGPEFRFKNNTGYPIRIDVTYADSKITVTIVGTKTDDTYVKMTYEQLSTTGYETEYRETDELPWGTQKQDQNGYTGREVITYRNVYDGNDNLISRTVEAKSVYQSRNQLILVGTAGRPADETPPPDQGGPPDAGSDSGLSLPQQPDTDTGVPDAGGTQPDAGGDEPELPPE